jgi:polar amino acid transport system substrate-binding protein
MRTRALAVVVLAAALLIPACSTATETPVEMPLPAPRTPLLFESLPQAFKDAGVIRFAGDAHPPYRTVAPDGTITGVDVDLQDGLSRVLGVRVEIVPVEGLPQALDGMLADRFDAFNGPVKATAEREKQFDTITWMTTHTSYVVPANSPVVGSDDLCGRQVGFVAASVVEGQLTRLSDYCQRAGRPAVKAVSMPDTNATIEAAQSGGVDAAGMTQAAAIDVTSQRTGLKYVTQTQQQGASTDFLAMLVPKDSELGPVMLEAFQELFDDGTYTDIVNRYGLSDVAIPEPVFNVSAISADAPATPSS